ncbi:MAG TPA: hypothetical protein PLM96_05360 [Methanoregulaceae archaeon]|jgi:hypothetical protein|nr:hypothetical protein [Methanolinea sp.]HOP68036.1 hypothetical protein [Methanoregulaceae archaeon]HPJ74706.1 hypothetical protein [Methanoregulaceae archaeon]HPQ76058.1 hypothetical protein [Methanoregulaceae archaeon]HQC11860.1 hypothetical protein [Methanoregulaceae archaeon]
MKEITLVCLLILAVFIAAAGCTQAPTEPQATPEPTSMATPSPTAFFTPETPAGMGIPGPTQSLPPQYSLTFQVTANGNMVKPLMFVGLMGGNGLNYVSLVEVTLTKPDGSSETQSMRQPFSMGENLEFPCSTDKNRIEIWATAPEVGRLKVYDEIVPFRSLNPS